MNPTYERIAKAVRGILALVMLVALFLPFKSCGYKEIPADRFTSQQITPGAQAPAETVSGVSAATAEEPMPTRMVKNYHYVLPLFDVDDVRDWLLVMAFIWPLVWFNLRLITKRPISATIIWGIEPLMAALGIFAIVRGCSLDTPEIGAWLSACGNATWLLLWIGLAIAASPRGIPHWRRSRARANQGDLLGPSLHIGT